MNSRKRHPHVLAVQKMYGDLIQNWQDQPMGTWAKAMIDRLESSYRKKEMGAWVEIQNWHPDLAGKGPLAIWGARLHRRELSLVFARSLGFNDWEALSHSKQNLNASFQRCVDHLLQEGWESFQESLLKNPELISQTSPFGHQAGLLHYLAANGVESWRQQVPLNALEKLQFLLEKGADPKADHRIYGGQFSLVELIETSLHPTQAGVAADLIHAINSKL